MREVVCFDKDFITGEVNTVKKYKPKSMAQGKVTVSLFDEKGNKLKEAKTENVVYDWIKPMAFKKAYELNFGLGTYGAYQGYADILDSASGGNEGLSKWLMLFNGDHNDINPKEALIKDTMVGYAGRYLTYSGSSTEQGSYNSAESSIGIDDDGNLVFHMVYDFPTHAANGTITGVGMGSYTTNTNVELFRSYYSSLSDSSYGIARYQSGLWFNKDFTTFAGLFATGSSSSLYLGVMSRYNGIQRRFSSTSTSAYSTMNSTSYTTETHYGNPSYYIENGTVYIPYNPSYSYRIAVTQGYEKEIKRYDLYINYRMLNTDGTFSTHKITFQDNNFDRYVEKKDTITTSSTTGLFIHSSSMMTKEGNALYYFRTSKGGETGIYNNPKVEKAWILLVDKEGYIIGEEDVSNLVDGPYAKWVNYGDEYVLFTAKESYGTCSKVVKCDANLSYATGMPITDLNFIGGDKIDKSIASTIYHYNFMGNTVRPVIAMVDDEKYQRHKFDQGYRKLSSYTRLPSPIIKTNTNTMKVQYDIVIEDIDPYEYIEYANRG